MKYHYDARTSVAFLTQITPLPTASVVGGGREGRKEGESSFICWGLNPELLASGYQRMMVMSLRLSTRWRAGSTRLASRQAEPFRTQAVPNDEKEAGSGA